MKNSIRILPGMKTQETKKAHRRRTHLLDMIQQLEKRETDAEKRMLLEAMKKEVRKI